MAVETTATSASLVGTGVASNYVPGFYVNSSDQVKVYVDSVLKTLGVDYTVNGVGASAGCTIVGTFAGGSAVYIERATPITQLVDTQNNETILEDVLDAEFDKLTMIAQEIAGDVDRAVLVPKGETISPLPVATQRANKYLGFDALGQLLLLPATGEDTLLRGQLASSAQGNGAALVAREGGGTVEATLIVAEVATRQGAGNYNAVFAAPPAADIPVVTSAASTQVASGVLITPTTNFYYDPTFRYDGTYNGAITLITGGIRPLQGQVCPEIETDAQEVEFEFAAGRTGTQGLHLRVLIDGKWVNHTGTVGQMLRFAGTNTVRVFFKLTFATGSMRRIKIEQEGCTDFFGVRLSPSYTIARRPSGDYRAPFVCIGDSLTQGGQNIDGLSGSYFYCRWESHSRFQAALMGCDSYLNLGAGGTGWSDVVAGNRYGDRVTTALAAKPAVIFFAGSRNDFGRESQVIDAVRNALSLCAEVPVVLTCGPQQAGYTALNDLVRKATAEMGRRFLNLDGVAASPASNPTGHPTFAECIALAKAGHAQTDAMAVQSRTDAAFYARPAPTITLASSATPPIASGTALTFTATVGGGYAGTVQFYVNGAASGSAVAISGGTATSASITLPAGTNTVTARYLPTDLMANRTATSAPLTVVVNTNTGFADNFNRADGAVGSTSTGSKAWLSTGNVLATWTVASNQLARATAAGSDSLTVDTGLANGTLQATMQGTYHKQAGLIFRHADGSNYWRLDWTAGTDAPVLTKLVAGVPTIVATGSAGTWTAGDVISIVLNEGSITVKKNGTNIVTATDTALLGNSRAGFWTTVNTTAVRFDDASFA